MNDTPNTMVSAQNDAEGEAKLPDYNVFMANIRRIIDRRVDNCLIPRGKDMKRVYAAADALAHSYIIDRLGIFAARIPEGAILATSDTTRLSAMNLGSEIRALMQGDHAPARNLRPLTSGIADEIYELVNTTFPRISAGRVSGPGTGGRE